MNDLRELIGQTVTVRIPTGEEYTYESIKCKVSDISIEDYYFEEKGEEINIRVYADPIENLPKGVCSDDLIEGVSLDNIRKY